MNQLKSGKAPGGCGIYAEMLEGFFYYGRTTMRESPHTLGLALPDWSDGRKLMRMTRFLAKPMEARKKPRSLGPRVDIQPIPALEGCVRG